MTPGPFLTGFAGVGLPDYSGSADYGARVPPRVYDPTDAPRGDLRQWARMTSERVLAILGAARRRGESWATDVTDDATVAAERRRSYEAMLREPILKTTLAGKVEAVAQLDLQGHAYDPDNPAEVAANVEFVPFVLSRAVGGTHDLIWKVLFHGLLRGWSLTEPVWDTITEGKWAGRWGWSRVKAKPTRRGVAELELDEFLNVTAVLGRSLGGWRRFDPADFLIWTNLPLDENPFGHSDFDAAFRAWKVVRKAWEFRAYGLERFSLPYLHGKVANEGQRAALHDALTAAAQATFVITDLDTTVEAIDLAMKSQGDYESAIRTLWEEMALAVSGAPLVNLTSKESNPRGDTAVQKSASERLEYALALAASTVLTHQAAPPLVRKNFPGVASGYYTLGAVNEADLLQMAQTDDLLANRLGLALDRKDAYKRYSRVTPATPADALRAPPGGPGGGGNGGAPGPGGNGAPSPNGGPAVPFDGAFAERFCMEGQNRGKPGPCPTGGPEATAAPKPAGQARARVGGEIAPNGEHYAGGTFIATTELPKMARTKLEKLATGREQLGPTEWGVTEPGQVSLFKKFQPVGRAFVLNQLDLTNDQALAYIGSSREEFTALAARYAKGERTVSAAEFPHLMGFSDAAKMVKAGMPLPEGAPFTLEGIARRIGAKPEQLLAAAKPFPHADGGRGAPRPFDDPAATFAEGEEDPDLDEQAELIAEILYGTFGADVAGAYRHAEADHAFAAGWDPLHHPRGKDGRFIPKGSAEAVATAKQKIGALKGKPATPENVAALASHLHILTVPQLRALHKEHGLTIPGRLREQLVAGVKAQLLQAAGKAPEEKAPAPEPPKTPAAAPAPAGPAHADPARLPTDAELAKGEGEKIGYDSLHSLGMRRIRTPGGTFYHKPLSSSQAVAPEVLTSDLARLGGVDVPAARAADFEGRHGVLTHEAPGVPLAMLPWSVRGQLDPESVSRQVLFGYLANVKDRHAGNYIVRNERPDPENRPFLVKHVVTSIDHESSLDPYDRPSLAAGLARHSELLSEKGDPALDPGAVKALAAAAPRMAEHLRAAGKVKEADALALRAEALKRLAADPHPTMDKLAAHARAVEAVR